jgi:dTMP kinase
MTNKRGKLICLESADGAGKTTQIDLITKYFEENKLSYVCYHFPTYNHNQFSSIIAKFLKGDFGKSSDVDPLFVASIYAMDRFRFLPDLEKALAENDVVLLDRYVYSNIAYQCAKFNNVEESLKMKEWIFEFEFNFLNLPYPDLSLFLNVPIEIIKERLATERKGKNCEYLNGSKDIHEEDLKLQENVIHMYKMLKNESNCKLIQSAINVDNSWVPFKPKELFNLYKNDLNHLLFNTKY